MFEIGKTSSLEVLRAVPMGLILGTEEQEVLLPGRYVPPGAVPGDVLEVFIYTDSEDRPIATTETPLVRAGEFACLRVVSVNPTGAFLDWGLPKDLLLPYSSQLGRARANDHVVVRVLCDPVSGRPVATAKIERFLEATPEDLREGQAVEILVYERTDLGLKTITNGRFGALLYPEAGQPELEPGDTATAFVHRIRADGKVDLGLAARGRTAAQDAREVVLAKLLEAGGRIDLGDQSDPDAIRATLGLSKKAYKRAIGMLYREGRIRLAATHIELTDSGSPRTTRQAE
jgi:hypothetical protein